MWPRRAHLAAVAITALATLAAGGCQRSDPRERPQGTESVTPIADAIARHAPELMAIPGVVGVYEGETARRTPCIRILVVKRTRELEKRLPRVLEGWPVEIEVSGVIRPM